MAPTVGLPNAARRVAAVAIVCAYAWWAVSLPPFSETATAAVVGAGMVAAVVGSRRTARPRRLPDVRLRWAPWAVLAAAAAAWQGAAYLQHPRHDHPTLSSLANALLDSHPARATAFVLWLLATVCLARR